MSQSASTLASVAAPKAAAISSLSAFQQSLAATAAHLAEALPPIASRVIDAGIARLEATDATRHALRAGQLAPDFTLPDAASQPVRLGELLNRGPVVLVFYRGSWCPYCSVQLRAYEQILPELARRGATLVAVSPQTSDHTALTVSEKSLSFPVLSDVGNAVARQYGLAYEVGADVAGTLRGVGIDLAAYNGTEADELPLTGTFVIAPDGRVAWADVAANFKHRPDPEVVLTVLATLPVLSAGSL